MPSVTTNDELQTDNLDKCRRCAQHVGWVGIVSNLVLVILKYYIGIVGDSKACLADALHSSSNIITAFAIFISRKYSDKPATKEFPYGYGKIEYLMVGIVSILVLVGALFLAIISIRHLFNHDGQPPSALAIVVAIISIISNELIFRYFRCVGTRLNSQTILANAWANRADCLSSVGVIIGVAGSKLGILHLDPIAALLVVVVIGKISINFLSESVSGLLDKSVSPRKLAEINALVLQLEDILSIDNLRAKFNGQKMWIEIRARVVPRLNVEDCQRVRENIILHLHHHIQNIGHILVDLKPLTNHPGQPEAQDS